MAQLNSAMASPEGDESTQGDRTLSAGEVGSAESEAVGPQRAEVIIGEIPAPDEPTTMLWTARCSEPGHDLLGHFATRDEAETARMEHLKAAHGGST